MICMHFEEIYKYQIQKNGAKHWMKFCETCGKRLSNPWCAVPGIEEQKKATEFKQIMGSSMLPKQDIDIFEDEEE